MIVIKGEPIAKKRPRFARVHDHVKTYDIQADEVKTIKVLLKSQVKERLEGPVSVKINFFMGVPASYPKKRKAMCLSGEEKPAKKPDLDNQIKFMLDCLNGVAWYDDNQVINIISSKRYDEVPRTEISICIVKAQDL